jgi:hypothetical protein
MTNDWRSKNRSRSSGIGGLLMGGGKSMGAVSREALIKFSVRAEPFDGAQDRPVEA